MKRKRINSQIKEPMGVPYPMKLPEIKLLPEPIIPALYPAENPLVKPPIELPVESSPFQVPKPTEF